MATRADLPRACCYIDAHVHVYPMFDIGCLLASAADRIGMHAAGAPAAVGCLLLAETARDHAFDELRRRAAAAEGPAGWGVVETLEEETLVAHHAERPPLVIAAGRQVRTVEGLEVLSLISRRDVPDGLSLAATVAAVRAGGGTPVLPWGFGKWWFGRGRLLRAFLASAPAAGVHLGDSAGRPRGSPEPAAFRWAARGSLPLPGSDPLPLPGEERRVASYGLVLEGPFDLARPAASLRRLIAAATGRPRTFGRRTGWWGFVRAQAALRW
ncbi:MAG TPA: hypothetical protein VFG43_12515 [Geminicoccaceae bacterium]|nr:hypothetical protein [Geminicoccaceae bacterium]